MHHAHLSISASNRIVGFPKIGHQSSLEFRCKELQQSGRTTRAINHIKNRFGIRKTPQPVGFTIHSLARFVTVKHRRLHRLNVNLLVPLEEQLLQPVPDLDQATRADLLLEVEIEDLDDLAKSISESKMQPRP